MARKGPPREDQDERSHRRSRLRRAVRFLHALRVVDLAPRPALARSRSSCSARGRSRELRPLRRRHANRCVGRDGTREAIRSGCDQSRARCRARNEGLPSAVSASGHSMESGSDLPMGVGAPLPPARHDPVVQHPPRGLPPRGRGGELLPPRRRPGAFVRCVRVPTVARRHTDRARLERRTAPSF